jgi:hypothetical protein
MPLFFVVIIYYFSPDLHLKTICLIAIIIEMERVKTLQKQDVSYFHSSFDPEKKSLDEINNYT